MAGPQAAQLPPAMPQLQSDSARHCPDDAQQPSGHETASQTQAPPLQRCPAAHAALPPQLQAPATQPSARRSQLTQASPGRPQLASELARQSGPEQQPAGHLVALQLEQAPLVQLSPGKQAWQAPPPVPQLSGSPSEHSPVGLQQPAGQETASQTQAPWLQRWPAEHRGPGPQRQTSVGSTPQLSARPSAQTLQRPPAKPQWSSVGAKQLEPWQHPSGQEVAVHTQPPFLHSCPGPHGDAVPQRQAPSVEQELDVFGSQATQVEPWAPQRASWRGWQRLSSQQPRQTTPSQTHRPPRQI